MARRENHLGINEYARGLPEGVFITHDTHHHRFVVKMHGDDGRPIALGTVKEVDPLCWADPVKTFAFVAMHFLRRHRQDQKKEA
jgi:hypothetical protein